MNFWLIKSEPSAYSWEQLKKDKKTDWTGVRNYAARNNLRDMKKGDLALFYHSNVGMEIVGIAVVLKDAYQDPTSDKPAWLSVEFGPYKDLKKTLSLEIIKKDPKLMGMDLVRLQRLSVGKVTEEEFKRVCELCDTKF